MRRKPSGTLKRKGPRCPARQAGPQRGPTRASAAARGTVHRRGRAFRTRLQSFPWVDETGHPPGALRSTAGSPRRSIAEEADSQGRGGEKVGTATQRGQRAEATGRRWSRHGASNRARLATRCAGRSPGGKDRARTKTQPPRRPYDRPGFERPARTAGEDGARRGGSRPSPLAAHAGGRAPSRARARPTGRSRGEREWGRGRVGSGEVGG